MEHSITATDITTIDGDATGTITVSNDISITGSAAQITSAVAVIDTFSATPSATLDDAHTLAELKAINNAITGTISLNDYTVALEGSTSDVKAALAGTFGAAYTGNVTLNDANTINCSN